MFSNYRYTVGDAIYYRKGNRIVNAEILRVIMIIKSDKTEVFYAVMDEGFPNVIYINENDSYCSVESLTSCWIKDVERGKIVRNIGVKNH